MRDVRMDEPAATRPIVALRAIQLFAMLILLVWWALVTYKNRQTNLSPHAYARPRRMGNARICRTD
jgi:hypothetical protein